MKRIVLTDGSGRWFDAERAEVFEEDTWWDGRNHRSRATGSQWEHEKLYRTASGRGVLHHWSQYQGVPDRWEEIDAEEAARWLSINGYDPHPACAAEYAALDLDAAVEGGAR
jgi:hypothetical protein